MHDAVGIDVEGDFDLRHTTRGGRQVDQLKLAEGLVIRRHFALTLQHVDLHRWLHVFGRGECFGASGRNRGVALNQAGHDATFGFDAER